MQENFDSIESSSTHGRTPSTQLPSSGYPLHNSPRLQHSIAVSAPQRTTCNRPDVKLGENIQNTTSTSSHGRTLNLAEYTLPSSPRFQQSAGVDTAENVLYTHSDRMAEETLHNIPSSPSRGHSLAFVPHRSPSPSSGHALRSSPRFSEMHERTDMNLLQMPENYCSFAYGRTPGPSSTQVSLLSSENNLRKSPPLFMVRRRAGTDSPEYSKPDPMTEQNFETLPGSSHAVPPPQQPLPPASAQNLLPKQMVSKTPRNSEWRENSRYYNPQLNEAENKNKGEANNLDQQSGGKGFEKFQGRRIRMSSVSQRFCAENGGVRNIGKNDSVVPLLSGLEETSFASQGICSLQARQVSCDKQTTENYCKHPSHNAKIVDEIPTEHYEKRLQGLCNCRSLDDGLAQIARLLNGIYLNRLQDIDNNGQCDKDLVTFQEWLDILLKINHSVLTNMEELESEVAKCLECARCIVKPGYRLNQKSQNGELQKCRQDIKSLIKIVQNAYHHNNWNFDGISLATVSLSQILGASVPNDENLRADDGAAQMQPRLVEQHNDFQLERKHATNNKLETEQKKTRAWYKLLHSDYLVSICDAEESSIETRGYQIHTIRKYIDFHQSVHERVTEDHRCWKISASDYNKISVRTSERGEPCNESRVKKSGFKAWVRAYQDGHVSEFEVYQKYPSKIINAPKYEYFFYKNRKAVQSPPPNKCLTLKVLTEDNELLIDAVPLTCARLKACEVTEQPSGQPADQVTKPPNLAAKRTYYRKKISRQVFMYR
uniref:Uncharacterized protein n=1 Tax=Glossina austeni TaxID=7395 RepID=A0A1A9VH63_GLOAU